MTLLPRMVSFVFLMIACVDSDVLAGYMNFGQFPYKDTSGHNLDSQVLAFKVEF